MNWIGVLFLFLMSAGLRAQDTLRIRKDERVPFNDPEVSPVFKGDTLGRFVSWCVKCPQTALDNNVYGTVYVSFVINEDGTVSDTKVLRGVGFGLDEEAVRIAKLTSGHWIPGQMDGMPVKCAFALPIRFRID